MKKHRWGKPKKNVKRIDPRYFLSETTYRGEDESPHLGKSVNEIADWHIVRWDKNRRDYRLALGQEMADGMVNEMVDFAIRSMKEDPSIKDEFYPHLTEVEYNQLIRILEEDRLMNTPR